MREKTKGAVALGYKMNSSGAPKVLAKGSGLVAEKIISIARDNGVLIQEDASLYEAMKKLEVGEEIPVKLYKAVAEVLAYVYKINAKKKRGYI